MRHAGRGSRDLKWDSAAKKRYSLRRLILSCGRFGIDSIFLSGDSGDEFYLNLTFSYSAEYENVKSYALF